MGTPFGLSLSPTPSREPAFAVPLTCEVPKAMNQLRNSGLLVVGAMIAQANVQRIRLIGLNGHIFYTSGNTVRVSRIPSRGAPIVFDSSLNPNRDGPGRPVFGKLLQ